MGKSTISMAIFNSKLLVYQRVCWSSFTFPKHCHMVSFQGTIWCVAAKNFWSTFRLEVCTKLQTNAWCNSHSTSFIIQRTYIIRNMIINYMYISLITYLQYSTIWSPPFLTLTHLFLKHISYPSSPSLGRPDVWGPPRGSAAPPRSPSGEPLSGRRPGVAFPWLCHGFSMGFPWVFHVKTHGLPGFSMAFPETSVSSSRICHRSSRPRAWNRNSGGGDWRDGFLRYGHEKKLSILYWLYTRWYIYIHIFHERYCWVYLGMKWYTWLVVLTILKNMSSSMGRMTSHIWNGK